MVNDISTANTVKARRTQADKMKISVELVKISVEKLVETNSNDKFHSVRLLTIWSIKIKYNLRKS